MRRRSSLPVSLLFLTAACLVLGGVNADDEQGADKLQSRPAHDLRDAVQGATGRPTLPLSSEPIRVFEPQSLTPAELSQQMQALTADRSRLLFRSATFDPVRQGMPDFRRYVPTKASYDAGPAGSKRHWIVQFDHRLGAPDLAGLRAAGATPLFYVPNDAYLVRAPANEVGALWGLDGVRWIGRYLPGFKVEPTLGRMAAAFRDELPTEEIDRPYKLSVVLTPESDLDETAAEIATGFPAAEVVERAAHDRAAVLIVRGMGADLAPLSAFLANLESVLWIEQRLPLELRNDQTAWIMQNYDRVNRTTYAASATIWNHGIQGSGQIVAVTDTGMDPDTCWSIDTFDGVIPSEQVSPPDAITEHPEQRKIHTYNVHRNFEVSAVAYETSSTHGNWVANCVAGDDDNFVADGTNLDGSHHDSADGMAPAARLVLQDIGDASGNLITPPIIEDLLVQAYNAGARISTNSFGTAIAAYDLDSYFADLTMWKYPDYLVFVAAGNAGALGSGTIEGWANAKNIVTVGASDTYDPAIGQDPENLYHSSSRGPTNDGRLKPDLLLTGDWVRVGTTDGGEGVETCSVTGSSGSFSGISGTSFASPLAAGAAALVREYFVDGWYPSGTKIPADGFNPSAALVKAALINGARNLVGYDDSGPCVSTGGPAFCLHTGVNCNANPFICDLPLDDDAPSNDQGHGRVMLEDAMYFSGDSRGLRAWDVPREGGVSTGDVWRSQFYVDSNSETLEMVLTWTDPPPLFGSASTLVNDLDVKLTSPGGDEYWGNSLETRDGNNATVEQTEANVRKPSAVDNVEYVRVNPGSITTGVWTVEVLGTSVPGSPDLDDDTRQDFAVVVTGDLDDAAGIVSLNKRQYDCDDTLTIRVDDSNAGGSVNVTVETFSGDSETVNLPSIGAGAYEGTIATTFNTPIVQPNGGTLELVKSESISVSYTDGSPAATSVATATVDCDASIELGQVTIAGGCDLDNRLDAGEAAEATISLVNPGVDPLRNVRAELISRSEEVYVEPGVGSYGDIPPGGVASNGGTPFLVSAKDTVAPLSSAPMTLIVYADGREDEPFVIEFDLGPLEADEIVTMDSFFENFTGETVTCNDTTLPAPDGWYYFDLDDNCATAENNWAHNDCTGDEKATLPSCVAALPGNTNVEQEHWLISPIIVTGPAGSDSTLLQLSLRETVVGTLNPQGSDVCDRMHIMVFSSGDGSLNDTEYLRGLFTSSQSVANVVTTTDFSNSLSFSIPPLPPRTSVQLIFYVALDDESDPLLGTTGPCASDNNDFVRWLVDDVNLTYENREDVADTTGACAPGCSDPATPLNVTVTEFVGGELSVGWDPVSGADHYDLRRQRDGGAVEVVARIFAPLTSYTDSVDDDANYSYEVRAVSQNGLCESGDSLAAALDATGPCKQAPAAPGALSATNDKLAGCQITVDWDPAAATCAGHSVEYHLYRGTESDFTPGPGNLLAITSSTSHVDDVVATGVDPTGGPIDPEYSYIVRAVDTTNGIEETNTAVAAARATGPTVAGDWFEDGGDTPPAKMRLVTLADDNNVGASWSNTSQAISHQSGGVWTYWTDNDPGGDGSYDALACTALETPPIELDGSGNSQLAFWINYQIEWQWDGLVIEMSVDGGAFAPITPIGGYPGDFSQTVLGPCDGGTEPPADQYINRCNYPPGQGAINGPSGGGLSDWIEYVFDLDNANSTIVLRFNLSTDCGASGAAIVDEIEVTNAQLPTQCTAPGCFPAPEFPGVLAVSDLDPGADTGVELRWGTVDWGPGGAGTFRLHRSGDLVTTLGPGATSYTDNAGVNNRTYRYAVHAVSGVSCSLPDDGETTLPGTDCTDALPGDVDAAQMLLSKTDAVVIRSTPIPDAGSYEFVYSSDPTNVLGGGTTIVSPTPELRLDILTDGLDYFFKVVDGASEECAP